MTTENKLLPQQARTPAVDHSYKETPGIKKLKKGYKLLPREAFSGNGNLMINAAIFTVFFSLVIAMAVYAAAHFLNISTGWATAIIVALGITFLIVFLHPVTIWTFHSPLSPFVINKEHRATLKQTRLLAQQLGESVVPTLTEDHINAIQKLLADLKWSRKNAKEFSRDRDRLTILLLEDLNREPLLSNLIINRGITDMDEIEDALRSIETDTIKSLEEGWL